MAIGDPTEDPGFVRWVWPRDPMCPACGGRSSGNEGRKARKEFRVCRSCRAPFISQPIGYETDHGGRPVLVPSGG